MGITQGLQDRVVKEDMVFCDLLCSIRFNSLSPFFAVDGWKTASAWCSSGATLLFGRRRPCAAQQLIGSSGFANAAFTSRYKLVAYVTSHRHADGWHVQSF